MRELPSPIVTIRSDPECRSFPRLPWVARQQQRGKGGSHGQANETGCARCGAGGPRRGAHARHRGCRDRSAGLRRPCESGLPGRQPDVSGRDWPTRAARASTGPTSAATTTGASASRAAASSTGSTRSTGSRRRLRRGRWPSSSRAETAPTSTSTTPLTAGARDGPEPRTAAQRRRPGAADQPRGVLLRPEGRAEPGALGREVRERHVADHAQLGGRQAGQACRRGRLGVRRQRRAEPARRRQRLGHVEGDGHALAGADLHRERHDHRLERR